MASFVALLLHCAQKQGKHDLWNEIRREREREREKDHTRFEIKTFTDTLSNLILTWNVKSVTRSPPLGFELGESRPLTCSSFMVYLKICEDAECRMKSLNQGNWIKECSSHSMIVWGLRLLLLIFCAFHTPSSSFFTTAKSMVKNELVFYYKIALVKNNFLLYIHTDPHIYVLAVENGPSRHGFFF